MGHVQECPPLSVGVGVGLVAGCTLAYQVVLTRLFSAVLPYHFSFLVISLALLGAGAGALFVYLRGSVFTAGLPTRHLARWSAYFALLLIVCPFLLVRLDYDSSGARFVVNLAAACTIATLPPLASGVVIALAISRYTRWVGRVYAFDLGGAGLGALVVVPALVWPPPDLLVALGA